MPELIWDFARQLDAAATEGNTTSYFDTSCQSFYIDNATIKTRIGVVDEGQWQDVAYDPETVISDSGYGNLDIEHHYNGAVYGSAQHSPDVVFLRYSYMLNISPMLNNGTWQMQPDNPIKQGAVSIKNTDNNLHEDNTYSLFLPGNRIKLRFWSGSSGPYEIGNFFIEDSPFKEIGADFKYSGRNHIGFYLASQKFDEDTHYAGTLTEIFGDILRDAGIDDTMYLIESMATEGTFDFSPTDSYMSGITSALEIADWYMDDQPTGLIVIGSAEFIRNNAASTGIYSFNRGSEVFTRSVSRNISSVFSRVCVNRKGANPLRVYADVAYYDTWHLTSHRTFYQDVPDNTLQADMERLAADLSSGLQYSGITETFDGPFRPWLQTGDVAYVTGGTSPRLAGIITDVQHDFGESGFYTSFTVTSGGEISNPENPETVASKYVGRMGGANRQRRLIDYLTGNISSASSAGSSPVGAVAYQAAVAGGFVGTEQDFNTYLALIAAGAVTSPGGTTGQVFRKTSNADYDADWADVHEVPVGGTEGQVLAKNSNTDYDTVWSNVQEIENQNGGMLKVWAGTDDEFAAIPELEAGVIWIVTQYDGSCLDNLS